MTALIITLLLAHRPLTVRAPVLVFASREACEDSLKPRVNDVRRRLRLEPGTRIDAYCVPVAVPVP